MPGTETKILFVAYYYPPKGGAGVQRSVKFVRYLPSQGIRPIVITGPEEASGHWEPVDASLGAEVPRGEVLRAEAARECQGPSRIDRLLCRLAPSEKHWQGEVERLVRQACEREDPELLYVSLSPYESLDPVLRVGRELRKPVVADLRDPWALDEVRVYPSRWHRQKDLRTMRRQFGACAAVIMNTPEAQQAARAAFPELPRERFACITNGYDREDFLGDPAEHDGQEFRIVHTGYLHTDMGKRHRERGLIQRALGGELTKVDFLTRSHYFLLRALRELRDRRLPDVERVRLHLLGLLAPADEAVVEDSGVADLVVMHGYTVHAEALRFMRSADLLFLPMHRLSAGRRARIVPGKTYEYLASGRPILAAIPEGDAKDFIQEAKAGRCVGPDSVQELAKAIASSLEKGRCPDRTLDSSTRRFERRALTAELAALFRSVLAARDS